MQKFVVLIISIFLASCSSTKSTKVVRDHGDCYVATLNFDNSLNDTSRVKFLKSAVFDTTATLVHGYIIDSKTHKPILNTDVEIFNSRERIKLLTNSQGEFEIFQDLGNSSWNMVFKQQNYICLYVVNVIQAGGQWFIITLEHI